MLLIVLHIWVQTDNDKIELINTEIDRWRSCIWRLTRSWTLSMKKSASFSFQESSKFKYVHTNFCKNWQCVLSFNSLWVVGIVKLPVCFANKHQYLPTLLSDHYLYTTNKLQCLFIFIKISVRGPSFESTNALRLRFWCSCITVFLHICVCFV